MEYQTLYRKYRPSTFELVFGQDAIIKTIKNVIKKNRLSHAYLFTGPRGTGKTSCAKLLAKAVNCLNNTNGDACGKCENCLSFVKNNNPDVIEIDAASNNGVDEIREIKSKINLVPSISKYKVYIIDEVHMLSIGAFNALLKTLEEPPEYVIFILATTEPQKIPATIISRCQRFDFKKISSKKMKECLLNIINKENIKIENDALDEIIFNSNGGMRDAIGLLDQSSTYCDDIITKKDIEDLSGNVSDDSIIHFIEEVLNSNYEFVFDEIENWDSNGKDFLLIIQKLINYIESGILYKKGIKTELITERTIELFEKVKDSNLYSFFEILNEISVKIKATFQKKNVFEMNIIYYIDSFKKNNDVSRETSTNKTAEEHNVSRETLIKTDDTVEELKNIRINNIILNSSKKELENIKLKWNNIKEYLTNEKYKLTAGLLVNSKPSAASTSGIIIIVDEEIVVKRLEKMYDNAKELINKICSKNYKIVFISSKYWQEIRPEYIKKYKNNELEELDENEILIKIKNENNKDEINEFADLIEME